MDAEYQEFQREASETPNLSKDNFLLLDKDSPEEVLESQNILDCIVFCRI